MAALKNSFAHTENVAFRRVEADIHKIDPESASFRVVSTAKTRPGDQVVLNPADGFATRRYGGVARIGGAQPARNRVRVKQVFASREIQTAGKGAFAGSIRPGDDGQDGQMSGSGAR